MRVVKRDQIGCSMLKPLNDSRSRRIPVVDVTNVGSAREGVVFVVWLVMVNLSSPKFFFDGRCAVW